MGEVRCQFLSAASSRAPCLQSSCQPIVATSEAHEFRPYLAITMAAGSFPMAGKTFKELSDKKRTEEEEGRTEKKSSSGRQNNKLR